MEPDVMDSAAVSGSKTKQLRYYTRGSVVPFEEDATHEFKGHKNLSVEEIPPWTVMPNSDKRTRAPVSKTLNGFINSGRACTVYLGIIDCGAAKGLNLTVFSKDHIISSLDDLFARYTPPVEPHRYSVEFIPVVDLTATEQEKLDILTYDPSKDITMDQRRREHQLRSHNYCWCHKEEIARYGYGIIACDYIVELHVAAWDPDNPLNKEAVGKMRAPPVHEDECGNAYFRRQASIIKFSANELYQMTRGNVQRHYNNMITEMREELQELRTRISGAT